jgi:enoyl-CoA hydratase/carnithine racemase
MATVSLGIELPPSLKAERDGPVAILKLNRPEKRNAFDGDMVTGVETFFSKLPDDIRTAVIAAEGEHFSAGLDLGTFRETNVIEGVAHSQLWHRAFETIEAGKVPVVAVLHGAVVGGGLEIAAACHVRVAERNAYYALPEGSRGIFVGGGGSVRIPRLIGTARMMDMMLTGRTFSADDGQVMGLTTYLVDQGAGFAKGLELAHRIAGNTAVTNFAVTHVLPRIAASNPQAGLAMETQISAAAQADSEAKTRLKDFLEKRGPKVTRS